MISIVDRDDELTALSAVLEERPALVVLQGRRRVGKALTPAADVTIRSGCHRLYREEAGIQVYPIRVVTSGTDGDMRHAR